MNRRDYALKNTIRGRGLTELSIKNIRNCFSKIIPQTYLKDPSFPQTLYKWIMIGLLIRFIFMPFVFHGDLLSTYHRSYLIISGGEYPSFYHLSELIQSLFLLAYQSILPLEKILLWPQTTHSVPDSFWLEFAGNNLAYRSIFLFKIPYLIFDFASAFLFLHLLEEKKEGVLAFKFWMVNPIVIFATYIFGRHETVTIFFILLSLFFAKRNRPYLALFSLGLGIYGRIYPLMFLPFFIFYLGKSLKKRAALLLMGSAVFLFGIATLIIFGTPNLNVLKFFETPFVNFVLDMRIIMASGHTIYIFIAGYVLLTLYYIYFRKKDFDNLWKFPLMALLLFYATSYFHAQFFAWFTPFIALAISKTRRFLELHLLQIFCFMFYIHYWGETWGDLFASVYLSNLINFLIQVGFLGNFFPRILLLHLFRTIFSAISVFMIGMLLFYFPKTRAEF